MIYSCCEGKLQRHTQSEVSEEDKTVAAYHLQLLILHSWKLNVNNNDYLTSLILAGTDNLQTRREHLIEQFILRNVLKEQSSLHYLLPTKRDLNIVNRLRHAKTFELSQSRTEKFRKSFIPYCLTNFQ